MGTISIWHWAILLIAIVGIVLPVSMVLKKAGFSRWWAILAIIPWVNFVALWVFASLRWPSQR